MAVGRADIEAYKALMRSGQKDDALAHLKVLIGRHGNDTGLLSVTAPLALQQGDKELAHRCYAALLDVPQISASDLFNIGFALKSIGRFNDALRAYHLALERGIDRPEDVYQNIGVILADELHDTAGAEKAFRRASAPKPQQSWALHKFREFVRRNRTI